MEVVFYILVQLVVPLVFLSVGIRTIWKAGKELYRWTYGCKKVMSRCVEVQQMQEDGVVLYRPIYEYEENGSLIKASKLDYEYENDVCVDNWVLVIIEKKHPDVVVAVNKEPVLVSDIVKVVVGVIITFIGFQAGLVIILSNLFGVFEF